MRRRRKKLALTLRAAEKATKIKKVHLVALEKNDWNNLPSEVYVAGFLNSYSKTLNLDAKKILKYFKKELKTHQNIQKKAIKNPRELKVERVYLTPKMVVITCVVLLILGLAGYLWFQVSGFTAAPKLLISEPAASEVKTKDEKINIIGETDEDSKVTLNNQSIPVGINGHFEQEISLQKGINIFEIVSTNNAGKKTTKMVQVMVE